MRSKTPGYSRDQRRVRRRRECAAHRWNAVRALGTALIATGLSPPAITHAAELAEDWQFRASLYGYFPNITGTTRFAIAGGEIDVPAEDLIENLEAATMGSFELQRGRWGGFADLIYISVGDESSNNTALPGGVALPPGVTADVELDVDASAFTLAASYRLLAEPQATLDVFAGARLFDANAELDVSLNIPLPGPAPHLSSEVGRDFWDGIVGLKGTLALGTGEQWFVPFYLDAGSGDSDFTWQASAGIGYATAWGEVFALYRHLDYAFASARRIQDLSFDGPSLGFAVRW